MHPAPSVILFTTFTGMGLGLLGFLSILPPGPGAAAFLHWGLAYALTVSGLLASTFHLGHPERAWRAFSQWRSSWLSREGIAAVATLAACAPLALSDLGGWDLTRALALPALLCVVATILATAMIYAQLRTVPRWHHWSTPALFLGFAFTAGALLSGQSGASLGGCLALALAMAAQRHHGATAFSRAGQSLGTATGLDRIGSVTVFEQPHTAPNYLMKEMIFHVGRKHADRLRAIAWGGSVALPALVLILSSHPAAFALASALHLIGALAQRWLFFAEAEHVVGLYYGQR